MRNQNNSSKNSIHCILSIHVLFHVLSQNNNQIIINLKITIQQLQMIIKLYFLKKVSLKTF